MQDDLGRNINYLRISVTDKCNLRCKYCMPPEGIEVIPHRELLTLEEISRLVKIMAGLGIKSVRFTGGEPLVRKNFEKLVQDVRNIEGIQDIAITTNGVLLGERLSGLVSAGITAVNISLDTVDAKVFREITGVDAFDKVLYAIEQSVKAGIRTKVNCVPCREWNYGELAKVAELAAKIPVDVRFIELMPVGCGREYHGIPTKEVMSELEKAYGPAKVSNIDGSRGNGPAQYYEFENFLGKIGFISPMSHKFCENCNRIRLTAEGRLKLCLNYNTGLDLKALLREGYSDKEIRQAIIEAVRKKPEAHSFENINSEDGADDADGRRMVQIGG